MGAQLGPFIGHGLVKGKGVVEVFSTAKPNVFVCLTKRDEQIVVNRNRVVFTRGKK